MSVRSVISIDVDDSSFQRFKESFDDFQSSLAAMPGHWQRATQGAVALASAAGRTAGFAGKGADAARKLASEQNAAARHAAVQERHWKNLAHNAANFSGRIGEATRSLLRWGALTGLISGVLGTGGLFGIDRLAISAGNQRAQGLALGMKPGEAKAFETQLGGRGYDANAFMGNINKGMLDVTSPQFLGLLTAGMDYQKDVKGRDAADVGTDYLLKLKKKVDELPLDESFLPRSHAQKLDTIMSPEDLQRLRRTPASEVAEYAKNIQQGRKQLGFDDPTAKSWQDLKVRLSETGTALENLLIKKLVNLAEPINKLSAAFLKAVETLLKDERLKEWIDKLAGAIEKFATYMLTDEFQHKVTTFVTDVATLVTGLYDFVTALANATKTIKGVFEGTSQGANGPLEDTNPDAPGSPAFYEKHPEYKHEGGEWSLPGLGGGDPSFNMHPQLEGFNRLIEEHEKLPPGLINSVYQTESGGGRYLKSSAGAEGPFQFMPDTAKRFGITNPYDYKQEAVGAGQYYHQLLDRYHGDIAKAAAGYNWGEGNVDKDIATYGDRWREHLPDETKGYVNRILGGLQKTPGLQPNGGKPTSVLININNNTGGNATVSASQLAI